MTDHIDKPYPDLLPDHYLQRAERLGAALLCDGMKGLDIPQEGCMSSAIRPLDNRMQVAGTALTVATANGDNFPIHMATYTGRPGFVMVIDGQGYSERAYIGELIIGAAKAIGFKGIIIDGCSRDLLACIELGLPVFSTGLTPRGPVKKDPGKVNVPIVCCGARVNPGDLVVADADGVAVVPRDQIEQVLTNAEEKQQYEIQRKKDISAYEKAFAGGEPLPNLAPQWVVDMLDKRPC